MSGSARRSQLWLVCLLLAVAVLALFWPALHCGFILYDDPDYVTQNRNIQNGLTWQSLRWAFATAHASNWHPLTWLSHTVDWSLYGSQPAGHHLTSLLLHMANAVLLFLMLVRLTGALWPCAFVAAMFAVHPLRVESVVWISERKDLLSTFFWMLAVGAYARYAENLKSTSRRAPLFYTLSLIFFALGLMAKPMLVTLPFLLLLLDYWPLRRLDFAAPPRWSVVLEKIPFLILAAGDSITTFLIQHHYGAVGTLRSFPLGLRLANVPVAYVRYIGKNFWPASLAIYYPFREWSAPQIAGAICVLLTVTFLAWRRRQTQPYLLVGWLWFLGTLVPAIGLVQVGTQSMADRYTYVPAIGLWIMVAWSVRDWIGNHPLRRNFASLAALVILIACMDLTATQVGYWQDTRLLFTQAAQATGGSYVAYYNIGCYAAEAGNFPEAIGYYKQALNAEPDTATWADHSPDYNDLGFAYLHEGRIRDAVDSLEKSIAIRPDFPKAYYNLGCAFLDAKQPRDAIEALQRAMALDPDASAIHYKLANALMQAGQFALAIAEYDRTLQLRPDMDEAANNLAWLLATCQDASLRNGVRAVALALQANQHNNSRNPVMLGTLAAAYAQTGNLTNAVATAQQARQLALDQNNAALAKALESQLQHYQNTLRDGRSP